MASFSRRRFFRDLALFGGAALLAPARAVGSGQSCWTAVGPAGKFKKDSVTQVEMDLPGAPDPEVVYITRTPGDTFSALSARCTHRGCVVDWQGHDRRYICPCHGGRFDAAGRNVAGPPPAPLRPLATRVDTRGILSVRWPPDPPGPS